METVLRNFGGMSTSRLNRNLRLDKHWSYGTQAAMPASRGPRPFYRRRAGADGQDEGSDASKWPGSCAASPASGRSAGEEFQSIMRNETLGLPGRFETLDALERAAVDIVSLGYPDDYYANYAKNVRALDEKALRRRGARLHPARRGRLARRRRSREGRGRHPRAQAGRGHPASNTR